MHHLLWIDLIFGTCQEEYVLPHTKESIKHYEDMGYVQILSDTPVKEDAK